MKKLHARELSRNQWILRFDVTLQHDWPIEQCLLHVRVFFGGKTKSPCFDLFIHWLMKQMTNTYRNHFSRSYENRSICYLQIYHNTPCFPPKIFHKHCLRFLLGRLQYPGEIGNNGYSKFWWANKVYYGRCANGEYRHHEVEARTLFNDLPSE